MRNSHLIFCSILMILSSGLGASLSRAADYDHAVVSSCAALKDEKSYKKDGGYKILVPGKDNVVFRSYTDFQTLDKVSGQRKKLYKALAAELESRGIALVNILLPPRGSLMRDQIIGIEPNTDTSFSPEKNFERYKEILADISRQGVYVVPFNDLEKDPAFYYKQDHHWSPHGAQEGAKRTAAVIKKIPQFKDIPPQEFETKIDRQIERPGVFSKFIAKLCGTGPLKETIDFYRTAPINAKQDEASLFGDTADQPYIALVGTSNSNDDASSNYAGWLRQNLGTDVRNFSMSGAGPEALLAFLSSDDFKKSPPKIIVWESHVSYDNAVFESTLKQAIPALGKICSPGDSLFKKKVTVTAAQAKNGVALFDQDKTLPDAAAYMVFDFSQPPSSDMTVELGYAQKSEKVKISKKIGKDKETLFSFVVGKESLPTLKSIRLTAPKLAQDVTLNYRLCEVSGKAEKALLGASGDDEENSGGTKPGLIERLKKMFGGK